MTDQIKNLTTGVLVHTSQMAYVEEAAGTHAMLEDFACIFRYLSREKRSISLKEELSYLDKYLHLQKIRFPGRFDTKTPDEEYMRGFIDAGTVIIFTDEVLTEALDSHEYPFRIELNIDKDRKSYLHIKVTGREENRNIHRQMELKNDL